MNDALRPSKENVWTKGPDGCHCVNCGLTWDMHICDGKSSCPQRRLNPHPGAQAEFMSTPYCVIHGSGACVCLGARYWMDRALKAEGASAEPPAAHGPHRCADEHPEITYSGERCPMCDLLQQWMEDANKPRIAEPPGAIPFSVRWAMNQLLQDLPQSRDWLNPDVEKIFRQHQWQPETKEGYRCSCGAVLKSATDPHPCNVVETSEGQ